MSKQCRDDAIKTYLNGVEAPDRSREIVGSLSGAKFCRPDVDSGYPVAKLIDTSGVEVEDFPRGDGFPDTRSHQLKLGVLVPATNCTVESEMWDIIVRKPRGAGRRRHPHDEYFDPGTKVRECRGTRDLQEDIQREPDRGRRDSAARGAAVHDRRILDGALLR